MENHILWKTQFQTTLKEITDITTHFSSGKFTFTDYKKFRRRFPLLVILLIASFIGMNYLILNFSPSYYYPKIIISSLFLIYGFLKIIPKISETPIHKLDPVKRNQLRTTNITLTSEGLFIEKELYKWKNLKMYAIKDGWCMIINNLNKYLFIKLQHLSPDQIEDLEQVLRKRMAKI